MSSGCCSVKSSRVSDGIFTCCPLVKTCTPVPAPPPTAAPIAAPLPPPATAPISAPSAAPPPILSADCLPREVPDCFTRSEEHTSELQSRRDLVCRLLL